MDRPFFIHEHAKKLVHYSGVCGITESSIYHSKPLEILDKN